MKLQRCANQPTSVTEAPSESAGDAEPGHAAHQHRRRRAPARETGGIDLGAHVLAGERERLAQVEARAQLLDRLLARARLGGAGGHEQHARQRLFARSASARCRAARTASPCRTDRDRARTDARRRRSARRLRPGRPSALRCGRGRAPRSRPRATPGGGRARRDRARRRARRTGPAAARRSRRARDASPPPRAATTASRNATTRAYDSVDERRSAAATSAWRGVAASTVLGGGVAHAHGSLIPRACYIAAHAGLAHRQLLGLLGRSCLGRGRDGARRPHRRAHRRLPRRADHGHPGTSSVQRRARRLRRHAS